jgi:NADH-quinone oxidoreductase subunit E
MAWIAEDRRNAVVAEGKSYLTDEMKMDIAQKYFPRYPTKRACLLPTLHMIQHTYNWIPTAAMEEVANFLEVTPAEVMDTATFYEEYWLRPKGKYLIQVCRSLSCEICQSQHLTQRVQDKFNLEIGETTPDGRFTLVELECLGSCGTAPVALVNEVLHEDLTPEKLDKVLNELPDDPANYKDPTVTWDDGDGHGH